MTEIQERLLEEEACVPQGARWYAVMTQSRREAYAIANLNAQNFETFLPQAIRPVKRKKRQYDELGPLFPRYGFVQLDLWHDRWRSVLGTFGVTTLIMENGRPRPAPVGLVETLIAATTQEGGLDFKSYLHEGQIVRFRSGPFAEIIGRLETLDTKGRVAVLLEIFGAQRIITANANDLMPHE